MEEGKMYTLRELEPIFDLKYTAIYSMFNRIGIIGTCKKRKMYYTAQEVHICIKYYEESKTCTCYAELQKVKNSYKKIVKKADREANMKNHVLVRNPIFLKESYFPDVTPICFADE